MLRFFVIGLVPIVFAAAGSAQSPNVLTEAEYLSALDETHPAVRESAEALARAEARAREAAIVDNPVLGAVREEPDSAVRQTDVLLSWRIPDVARGPEIQARNREVDAARARLGEQLLGLRLAMREAYAEWAVSEERRAWLENQAERVLSLAQRETARSERGEASALEANRLRLAAAALSAQEALAAADSERARGAAAALVPDLPIDVRPVLPDLPATPPLTGRHARVRAAEADLAAAEQARKAAGRFVASPEVSVGWQRQDLGPESIDGPVVGLAWSLPLFDRKQAARAETEARIDAARARLELAERQVSVERASAERQYSRISAALGEALQQLESTERILDGAEAAFRLGEASLTDLLDTHRTVTEAEIAALDLQRAALAAHRELERLAGAGALDPTLEPLDLPIQTPSQENNP